MGGIGSIHNELTLALNEGCIPIINTRGSQEVQTRLVMFKVIAVEEAARPETGCGDGFEAVGIVRLVLHGLELRLRKRVVVRGVRTIVTSGNTKLKE